MPDGIGCRGRAFEEEDQPVHRPRRDNLEHLRTQRQLDGNAELGDRARWRAGTVRFKCRDTTVLDMAAPSTQNYRSTSH